VRRTLFIAALILGCPIVGLQAQTIRPTRIAQLELVPLTTAQEGMMTFANGDMWYNSDLGCIRQRIGGVASCMGGAIFNVGDAVCFVHPDGNDAASGLSFTLAKQTLLACVDALTNGGTIYVHTPPGTHVNFGGTPSYAGLWMVGPSDPNYASPPAGWRQQKALNIIGTGDFHGNFEHGPSKALIFAPSQDPAYPTFRFSGVNVGITMSNIQVQYPGRFMTIGIDSDGSKTGALGASAGFEFHNISWNLNQVAGNGPGVEIGPGSFWIWFDHCTIAGNSAEVSSSDKHAGLLIDPVSVYSTGLIYVTNSIGTRGGGIKFRPTAAWSLFVTDWTVEGGGANDAPGVWFTNTNGYGFARLENIQLADYTVAVPAVRVDGEGPPSAVWVNGAAGSGATAAVVGPATVVGQYPAQDQNATTTPAGTRGVGFFGGGWGGGYPTLQARINASRRNFPPVAVRYANLAITNPGGTYPDGWNWGGSNVTITTGIDSPDGTAGAARVVNANGYYAGPRFYFSTQTAALGDIFIYGVWFRTHSGAVQQYPVVLSTGSDSYKFTNGGAQAYCGPAIKGQLDDWVWCSNWAKIGTSAGGNILLQFLGHSVPNSAGEIDFYGPVLFRIPAGVVSDNEAAEIALNLASYPNTASVGEVSGLPGQTLSYPKIRTASVNNIIFVDGVKYAQSVAGIKAAVDSLANGPGIVVLVPINGNPLGEYGDDGTTTVTISNSKQHVVTFGRWTPAIAVAATRTAPIFKVDSGSSAITYFVSIGGFAIDAGNNTTGFTAIQIINGSKVHLFNIDMLNGIGHGSIGVDIQGQDFILLEEMNLSADQPILINKNPYNPPRFDADFITLRNLELYPGSAYNGITIGTNISVTNLEIDHVTVAGGKRFLYWVDGGAPSTSSHEISILNCRHEQGTDATAYSFHIDRTGNTFTAVGLTVVVTAAAVEGNGFFLRNIGKVTLINPGHSHAGGVSVNADNSVYDLQIINPFFQSGSTISNTSTNNSSTGVNYLASGSSLRTGTAGTTFFLDLGEVTLRNGDATNAGGRLNLARIKASGGTALVAGDFALSAGWGTTASVGSVRGVDQFFEFVVTSAGTGQGASPTITYTPKDGTWTTAPIWVCVRQEYANQPTITFTTTTQTATSLVLTFGGTPSNGESFKIACHTGGI